MGIKNNHNKIIEELALRQVILNKKKDMSKNTVVKIKPNEQLDKIKIDSNFTISHLSKITNVKRDVISRFLDGKKINHIDYIKIRNQFPDIEINSNQTILPVAKLNMFGTIQNDGTVSQLMLNDARTILIPANISKLFTRELIGLHICSSNNKYVLQIREDHKVFNENEKGSEFLFKTMTNSFYGVMRPCDGHICLANAWDMKKLDIHKTDKVEEIYDFVMKISDKWSELKDNKFSSKEQDHKLYNININNK